MSLIGSLRNYFALLIPDPVLTSLNYEQRRREVLNYGVVVSILVLLFFIILYSISDFLLFLYPTLSLIFLIPFFAFSGYLNLKGKLLPSALIFNITLYLCISFPVLFFLGKDPSVHYNLLYFSILPLMTIPVKDKYWMVFFILLNQVTFFFIEIRHVSGIFPVEMTPAMISLFRNLSIPGSLLALTAIAVVNQHLLYSSEKITQKQNEDLNQLNQELSDISLMIEKQSQELNHKNKKLELLTTELSQKLSELATLNASKDNIFRIISHDLRAPIGNIKGITDLVIEREDRVRPEKLKNFNRMVNHESEQLLVTLDKIFSWAENHRIGIIFNPKQNDLKILLEEEIEFLRLSLTNKNIKIETEYQNGQKAYFDRELLSVVIRNLLHNAIKYSNRGSTIWVKVRCEEDELECSVADQGTGIQINRVKQIFSGEYLSSVPGTLNEQGTGIGLNICKNYIDQHSGRIWVESTPGEGSTFRFRIPVSKPV